MPCRHRFWSRRKATRCVRSRPLTGRRLPSNPTVWAFGTYGPATSRAIIVHRSPPCTEQRDEPGGRPTGTISRSNFIPGSKAKFTLPKFQADSRILCQPLQDLTISPQAGPVMESGSILPRSGARNPSRSGKCPFKAVRQPGLQRMVASPRLNHRTVNSFITASTNKAECGECRCRAARKLKF